MHFLFRVVSTFLFSLIIQNNRNSASVVTNAALISNNNNQKYPSSTCSSLEMTQSSKSFAVLKSLPAPRAHWVGDGFYVHPVLNRLAFTEAVSPWLMFDYAAPKHFPVNDPISKYNPPLGVGRHPHRGFETITIAFQGEVEHKDSQGGGGVIGSGDVQWMTAGRGIIHEEYHS